MSIMNLGRGNGNRTANGNGNGIGNGIGNGTTKNGKHVEPVVPPYPPRQAVVKKLDPEAAQLQLGTVTLDGVDRLTGMTADEIERVAEQVLDGAEETASVLRDLARRSRENGLFANERLARFVRVANQCADIARSMRQSVERRDEQSPPEPKRADVRPEVMAEMRAELAAGDEPEVAQVDDAPGLGAVEHQTEEQTERRDDRVVP